MDVNVKHLVNRNGKLYFRYRVPEGICFGKTKEIKVSLRTTDLKKAFLMVKLTSEKMSYLLQSGAFGMVPLEEIRRLIADYIKDSFEWQERHLASFGKTCPSDWAQGIKGVSGYIKILKEKIAENDVTGFTQTAESLLEKHEHDQNDVNLTALELLKANLYIENSKLERFNKKKYSLEYDEAEYKEILSGKYRPIEEIIEAEQIYTLNDLIPKFFASRSDWGESMRKSTKEALDLFLEYIPGNSNIKSVTHHNLLDFRDNILAKMPKHRANDRNLMEKSLLELVRMRHSEVLSKATINLKLIKICSFFNWCFSHRYLKEKITDGLQYKITRAEKAGSGWLPYETEELVKIFTNLRPDKLNAWMPHKLWIPLIALWSGARINEICQLQIHDIIMSDGLPCFHITNCEENDTRVKTDSSKRIIPIHPTLQKLGFFDFYQKRLKSKMGKKDTRLWLSLEYKGKYGYAHDYGKSYGRFKKEYVTDHPKKVFHSFRKNLGDSLKQQNVQEAMVAEILGHSVKSITFSIYGQKYKPSVLLEQMNKLDYGFNIFEVLGKEPLSEADIRRQIERLPKA